MLFFSRVLRSRGLKYGGERFFEFRVGLTPELLILSRLSSMCECSPVDGWIFFLGLYPLIPCAVIQKSF